MVLHWIEKDPISFKTFVLNRLTEIREKSKLDECTDRPLGVPHSPVILMQCKSDEYHATLKMCCITLL